MNIHLCVAAIAGEVAEKLLKVYDIESARFEPTLPTRLRMGCGSSWRKHPAKLGVDAAHHQGAGVRPKLATASQTTAISDAIGARYEGGKLLFTRQMFQGKFVADVSFAGSGPCFVATFSKTARSAPIKSNPAQPRAG